MMEVLRFVVLLLVFVLVQIFGSLASPVSSEEDGDIWTVEDWQPSPVDRGISIRLSDLIRRSKSQQFHGLMGRSSGAPPVRLGRKRNKGEMFVGLMGRRSADMDEDWKSGSY